MTSWIWHSSQKVHLSYWSLIINPLFGNAKFIDVQGPGIFQPAYCLPNEIPLAWMRLERRPLSFPGALLGHFPSPYIPVQSVFPSLSLCLFLCESLCLSVSILWLSVRNTHTHTEFPRRMIKAMAKAKWQTAFLEQKAHWPGRNLRHRVPYLSDTISSKILPSWMEIRPV